MASKVADCCTQDSTLAQSGPPRSSLKQNHRQASRLACLGADRWQVGQWPPPVVVTARLTQIAERRVTGGVAARLVHALACSECDGEERVARSGRPPALPDGLLALR